MAEKSKRSTEPLVSATDVLFARKKPNAERLLSFGFEQQGSSYIYTTSLMDEQFRLMVSLSDTGPVNTVLTETASGEEYVLHRIPGASGAFVGRVKEEYEAVLQTISEQCFEPDVFKSDAAQQVIQYVKKLIRMNWNFYGNAFQTTLFTAERIQGSGTERCW